ncbi:MAG TPA: hypothetical protein VGL89_05465 [Candidatus Koribacter sp.]|jgi:hypothetical protein
MRIARCAVLLLLIFPTLLAAADDASGIPDWRIRVLDFEGGLRFNYMDRQSGTVTDQSAQYRIRTRLEFNVRRDGSTFFTTRAETGRGFDNSWNNTGAGLGHPQGIFNLKSLAIHQKIASALELQAGGLEFDRGAATDGTGASGDGAMTGYRAVLTSAAAWLPHTLEVTAGYVGQFNDPNMFSRLRMGDINYVQGIAEHGFGERWTGSAEVSSLRDTIYSRAALRAHKLWKFDEAELEAAVRANDAARFAWSARVGHSWPVQTHLQSQLIYSDLPPEFYLINAQRALFNRGEFDVGKRLSTETSCRLGRQVELSVFAGRLLDNAPSKRWIAEAGLTYQFANLMNRILSSASGHRQAN